MSLASPIPSNGCQVAKEFSMKPDRPRKLELNRETIRALTSQEMAGVAGGALNAAALAAYAIPPITIRFCTHSIGCVTVDKY